MLEIAPIELPQPRHQVTIGICAGSEGVLAHRAFFLETELFIQPDSGRVVGEDVELDPFQVMPVIGSVQQSLDEERSEPLAREVIMDAEPERCRVSSTATLGVQASVSE